MNRRYFCVKVQQQNSDNNFKISDGVFADFAFKLTIMLILFILMFLVH